MKIRNRFVSNSSSSSFVIPIAALTTFQRLAIINHIFVASFIQKEFQLDLFGWLEDEWIIKEENNYLKGSVSLDNFDMEEFMKQIGVPMHLVVWDHF